MHARNTHPEAASPRGRQTRRAERRQAQRAATHAHQTAAGRRSNPWPLLSGVAVIVAALVVFGVVVLRQGLASATTANTVSQPMVDRTAFDPAVSTIKAGAAAPNFVVKHPDGRSVSLAAQRGHPVLLEFFATWCPVCHRETKVMRSLTSAYAGRGLRTLAVLANPYGPSYEISQGRDLSIATPADLRWYAHTYKADYPLLIDPQFRAVNRYGAGSYPTLYLIDSTGKVAFSAQGAVPRPVLASKIEGLIAQQ